MAAQAAFIFPLTTGSYHVYISCEGLQSVDHIGGDTDGYWIGLIAYNSQANDYWGVGQYSDCTITNYLSTSSWRPGHPDLKLNDCTFKGGQFVERDAVISFHIVAKSDNAKFYLMAPKTMKTDTYNFVVSYGGYTNKKMEFGSITVTIDEADDEAPSSTKHEYLTQLKTGQVFDEYDTTAYPTLEQSRQAILEMERNSARKDLTVEQAVVRNTDALDPIESESVKSEVKEEPDSPQDSETEAEKAYDLAARNIPDATEDVLPSKQELSNKPIDSAGQQLPKPREVLGTYQGAPIYPEDVPPVAREKLREAARSSSTLLYDRKPQNSSSKSLLSRFIDKNKSPVAEGSRASTYSGMTREQLKEYTRIRNSLGVTAAKEYKASLE